MTAGFRRPACGNDREAHGPHRFAMWSSDTGQRGSCAGWTPMEADVAAMAEAVLAAIAANEAAHPWAEDAPKLHLELSPAAAAGLSQCLDIRDLPLGGVLDSMFGMPIVPTADLPRGGWQITEARPVVASGTVSMDTTPHRVPPRGPHPDLVIRDDPVRMPWDDPATMARDLRQAVRDIGAGGGPIGSDPDALYRMATWGPCPDCGGPRDTRPVVSDGIPGKPGSAGVSDQLYCPQCGWPGPGR
jgi:hypothetical protein